VNNLKGKLETLCKELQKQNKLTQEEYRTTTETEQERRKEQSERFSATIKDVQVSNLSFPSSISSLPPHPPHRTPYHRHCQFFFMSGARQRV
jgi:hypothetical protein